MSCGLLGGSKLYIVGASSPEQTTTGFVPRIQMRGEGTEEEEEGGIVPRSRVFGTKCGMAPPQGGRRLKNGQGERTEIDNPVLL